MQLKFKNSFLGYFQFFYKIVRYRLYVAVFLSIIVSVLDGVGLAMLMPLLQAVEGGAGDPEQSMGQLHHITTLLTNMGLPLTLNIVLIVLVFLFTLKGIVKFLEQVYRVRLQHFFMKRVRYYLIANLQNLSYQGYLGLDAGKIQNTFISEVFRTSEAIKNYLRWSQSLLMLFTYVALAVLANYQFAFLVATAAGVSNLIYKTIYKRIKKASLEISIKGDDFNSYIIEAIHYFKYLKSTNYLNTFSKKLRKVVDNTQHLHRKMGYYSAITTGIREPMVVLIVVFVIYIQINWMGGNLGSIVLSLLLFYRGLNFLMNLQTEWQNFLYNVGALQTVSEVSHNMQKMHEEQGQEIFSSIKNNIELKNVSFSYNNNEVIKNVSAILPKNKTMALVGVSGSGKTTLVNIILGLIHPLKGEVLIDDKSLEQFNLDSYRSKIGYISQEPVVFNDTIFNNITFWADPNPENIIWFWEVIHLASLTDFIQQQDKKENAFLGDNGILISGGQKQRISIARELYKKSEILILDEATSALDSETELVIQENIENLHGYYTMIIIAHRLSTIKKADVIYLIENGSFTMSGNFKAMMEKSEKFKRMVHLQGL